ncbi:putative toxin-antitoxin system toxin component, PIN family [Candidatus Berkelbacteria bacterium]|nr:putative toxin-antitoxin system toxin component, PIN family [Candidatus Berkelbacteria bacterium]
MRVVLDTNIYLSGLAFPSRLPSLVLSIARKGQITTYCSPFILKEIRKNLIVKFGYSKEITQKFIEEILKFVNIVKPLKKVKIIKDKDDDNRILECALEINADFLITGDRKHILPLKKAGKTKIVTVREFLKVIHKIRI